MPATEATALAKTVRYLQRPPWNATELSGAAHEAPHIRAGLPNRELVEADAALNTAYWTILALVSPYAASDFAGLYPLVKQALTNEYRMRDDEARDIARVIARYLALEARNAEPIPRTSFKLQTRDDLLDLSEQRCWYCGWRFPASAIDRFRGTSKVEVPLPRYLDFVTGMGLIPRDLGIEIDHVQPHSRIPRGDIIDNLRLTCGWCNSHKGARSLIFDVNSLPTVFLHPNLGQVLRPQAFWVIRSLGTRRRCDELRCSATSRDTQLRSGPHNPAGALVPGNLGVFCDEHDPLSQSRYVARKHFQ